MDVQKDDQKDREINNEGVFKKYCPDDRDLRQQGYGDDREYSGVVQIIVQLEETCKNKTGDTCGEDVDGNTADDLIDFESDDENRMTAASSRRSGSATARCTGYVSPANHNGGRHQEAWYLQCRLTTPARSLITAQGSQGVDVAARMRCNIPIRLKSWRVLPKPGRLYKTKAMMRQKPVELILWRVERHQRMPAGELKCRSPAEQEPSSSGSVSPACEPGLN
jgi:hypothetical protein